MTDSSDEIGLCAQLACIWEATARKPGNVHPFCDFVDTGYVDFLASAAAIDPVLASATSQSVGATVLEAVRRTRGVARANTNLGIILLLAPLAKSQHWPDGRWGVAAVLDALTVEDAILAFQAIVLAGVGGLGQAPEQDVHGLPTVTLREAMSLAANRDAIARQYVTGFADVFDHGAPAILTGIERVGCLEGAIISAHLYLMARIPDTLIVRKRGLAEAEESSLRAATVLNSGWPDSRAGRIALGEFDNWLRAEGHQRNPGTTADLVAASLFVLLRQRRLRLPLEMPWTRNELWAIE
jgi:triphosphoribosyl-dephospho-CoA synthase